jgi:hypothetical protein
MLRAASRTLLPSSMRDGVADAVAEAFGDSALQTLADLGSDIAHDLGAHDLGVHDAKADPVPVSGTRLRVRYNMQKSADGAERKAFVGWQDTTRAEACAAQLAADGKQRCLPNADAYNPSNPQPIYADSACTMLLASVSTSACVVPAYFKRSTNIGSGCMLTSGSRMFRVGAEQTLTSWYQGSPGNCTKTTSEPAIPQPARWFALTEVAPTEFAEVTISEVVE